MLIVYPLSKVQNYNIQTGPLFGGQVNYITFDGGGVAEPSADYLVIYGHNLGSASATVVLQYSTTGAWGGEEVDLFIAETIMSDKVYLKEFDAPVLGKRYWRLKVTGTTVAPFIKICAWGNKTELDYVSASFDPNSQKVKANVNRSTNGVITGVHTMYTERSLSLTFNNGDDVLYNKVNDWWEGHGYKQVFVAWDGANNPDDVYLMLPSVDYNNPLDVTGNRDISVTLHGRKEVV